MTPIMQRLIEIVGSEAKALEVLAAIREPTEDMVKDAMKLPVSGQVDSIMAFAETHGIGITIGQEWPLIQWFRAMVDAIGADE